MKYLKRFNEEISSEKIRSVVAGSEATHKDKQKSRLLAHADKMDITAKAIEQQQKSKQAEAERMKDPQYAFEKQFKLNQDSLSRSFLNKNLFFYFTTKIDSKDFPEPICFKHPFNLIVSEETLDDYDYGIWGMEDKLGLERGTLEMQDRKQYIGLLRPSSQSFHGQMLLTATINNRDDINIPVLLTKEGIKFFPKTAQLMKEITGNINHKADGRLGKFNGLSLIGMDLTSKNELAKFIKDYDDRATCGNNNLKVNGKEVPTFGAGFEIDKNDYTTDAKPLEFTDAKMEEFGKIKSFLGFGK